MAGTLNLPPGMVGHREPTAFRDETVLGRVLRFLTSPRQFFSEPHGFEETFGWAAVSACVVGAMLVVSNVLKGSFFFADLPTIEATLSGLTASFVVTVIWAHAILKVLGGKGTFEDTYTVAVFVGCVVLLALAVPFLGVKILVEWGPIGGRELFGEALGRAAAALVLTVGVWSSVVLWIGLAKVHDAGTGAMAAFYLLMFLPVAARVSLAMFGSNLNYVAEFVAGVVPAATAIAIVAVFLVGLLITVRNPG